MRSSILFSVFAAALLSSQALGEEATDAQVKHPIRSSLVCGSAGLFREVDGVTRSDL